MKVGDSISLLNENLKGRILKIVGNSVFIKDEFGFEREVSAEEIVPRVSDLYEKFSYEPQPEIKPKKATSKSKKTMILDLHFEQLVENPTEYTAWERLFIQKEKVHATLDFCRQNKIKQLEIVHGVGDGVVQNMVLEVLRGEMDIEFEDNNLFKAQSGSVMVYF